MLNGYNPETIFYASNGKCDNCGNIGPAGFGCRTCFNEDYYYAKIGTVVRGIVFAKCKMCGNLGPETSLCGCKSSNDVMLRDYCTGERVTYCGKLKCTACGQVGPALFCCTCGSGYHLSPLNGKYKSAGYQKYYPLID
jgi:hypothetical protein